MTGEKVVGQTASHSASESNRFWLPCSQLFSSWLHKNDLNSGHRRKIYTEEKIKVGRRCCLGDELEFRSRKDFRRTSIVGG